ncbi:DUF3347 domain-containing protein [Mucilaginibacter sp. UYCu711]|jgi:hypothetical protein|uniref:DUF3347 domain-containing protein n=1 Tax=Mucilaginibacter sp. UYCu711 TaxID=3156339 RepID=UPI003D1CC8E6
MKTLKTVLLSLILLVVFAPTRAQEVTATTSVNNVITAYLGVKNALITGNNNAAKSSARELLAAINTVPAKQFTPEQNTLWTAFTDKLQFDSRHISESASIDHQREHFTSLSKNMFELVKGLKLNTNTLYEQYCPMKKATWLSESAAIKNPYYGSQMLTCGKTTETLAPVAK